MHDQFYPTVDKDFLIECIEKCGYLNPNGRIFEFGSTVNIIGPGDKPIFKRTILFRVLENNQVCFEQASAIAFRLRFLTDFLHWLESNRGWKDGAYI